MALAVDAKLRFPVDQVTGLPWAEHGGNCYAILERSGRMVLISGRSHDEVVLNELERLRDASEWDDLRLLADAYRPLVVEADHRIDLSTVMFHLDETVDLQDLKQGKIRVLVVVIRFLATIEIWSKKYRDNELERRARAFPQLPGPEKRGR